MPPKDTYFHMNLASVALATAHVDELAQFYAKLLGWKKVPLDDARGVLLEPPQGGPALFIQYKHEDKYKNEEFVTKQSSHGSGSPGAKPGNKVQLDFAFDNKSQMNEALDHALALGARLNQQQDGFDAQHEEYRYIRFLDPMSNPFSFVLSA